jgi:hypothetical protein
VFWQVSTGQGDNDGIVATQNDINRNNLQNGDNPGVTKQIHLLYPLMISRAPDVRAKNNPSARVDS